MSKKKSEQLGMLFGTACHRLRLEILFKLVQETGRDVCFRCGRKIEKSDELSIEHKKAWLDVSTELFWDLTNIAFSHRRCNRPETPGPKRSEKHGLKRYNQHGCRCNECKAAKSIANSKYYKK
jgi:hypothetical protein